MQVLVGYGAAIDTLDGLPFFVSTSVSYTDNMIAFFTLSRDVDLLFVGAVQDLIWQDTSNFVELAAEFGCSVTSTTTIRSTDNTLARLDEAYYLATQIFFLIAAKATVISVVEQLPHSTVIH